MCESFTKTSSRHKIPITTIKDHEMGKGITLEGGENIKLFIIIFFFMTRNPFKVGSVRVPTLVE
jgi:hypothetical protein